MRIPKYKYIYSKSILFFYSYLMVGAQTLKDVRFKIKVSETYYS